MSSTTHQAVEQPASFAFTAETADKVKAVIAKYPAGRQRSAVMPLLDLAQRQEGWVSQAAMDHIAGMLGLPPIRVYEVATFYTMFNLKPVGKHHVQVCTNICCWLRGSDEVARAAHEELGVHFGESTGDGLFTLSEVECLGACVNAPMMQINDDYYEDLDAESTRRILAELKAGRQPKPGPQIDRINSAPVGGPTTLRDVPAK